MSRNEMAAACGVAALWLIACGSSPSATPDPGVSDANASDASSDSSNRTITQIAVTPANVLVDLTLDAPGSQTFQAIATYSDGTNADVTSEVAWSSANPAVGTFADGTLSIPAFASETATSSVITAKLQNVTGQTQVTVVAHADPLVVLPYQDTAGPKTQSLTFDTTIKSVDAFILEDTTSDMSGELTSLKAAFSASIAPALQATVADTQFGLGTFMDFPISPYGSTASTNCPAGDQPFVLEHTITSNTATVQSALNGLTVGCGGDLPESGIEALYQVATGDGLTGPAPTSVAANHSGIGGVGFRKGAMPIIIDDSSAVSHGPAETGSCAGVAYSGSVASVAHSRATTKTALTAICARMIGIAPETSMTDACSGRVYMEDFATATGARVPPSAWGTGTRPAGCSATQCCTGLNGAGRAVDADGLCPLVYVAPTSGSGIPNNLVEGVELLERYAAFDVTTAKSGDPVSSSHTAADFVTAITPKSFQLPPQPPTLPTPTFDTTAFHDVTPGTTVSTDLTASNTFVAPTSAPQLFHVTVAAQSNACLTLDQRTIVIVVPPAPL